MERRRPTWVKHASQAAAVLLAACATAVGQTRIDPDDQLLGPIAITGRVTPIWTLADRGGDDLTRQLVGVGDVNGDGVPDVVSSSPFATTGPEEGEFLRGRVSLISGRTGAVIWTRRGEERQDGLGCSVSAVGDVDGDGVVDLAAGAAQSGQLQSKPPIDQRSPGCVLVLSGRDGHALRRIDGAFPGGEFGRSIAGLADVDGDGIGELIVGAPEDETDGPSAGRAFVYSLKDGSLLHVIAGTGHLGTTVSRAIDFDADGLPDFAITGRGADLLSVRGIGWLHSGRDGALLESWLDGESDLRAVAAVPDADGDEVEDLLLGSYVGPDAPGGNRARAVLVSGATRAATATFDEPPYAPRTGEPGASGSGRKSGAIFSMGTGDVDGDGHADVILGAGSLFEEPATVTVLSGTDGAVLLSLDDRAGRGALTGTVAVPGDLDGDGRADLVLSSAKLVVAVRLELPPER